MAGISAGAQAANAAGAWFFPVSSPLLGPHFLAPPMRGAGPGGEEFARLAHAIQSLMG